MMDLTLMPKNDVVNDLTTGGTDVPLSAEMGKVLNEKGGGSAPIDVSNKMTFDSTYWDDVSVFAYVVDGGYRVVASVLAHCTKITSELMQVDWSLEPKGDYIVPLGVIGGDAGETPHAFPVEIRVYNENNQVVGRSSSFNQYYYYSGVLTWVLKNKYTG